MKAYLDLISDLMLINLSHAFSKLFLCKLLLFHLILKLHDKGVFSSNFLTMLKNALFFEKIIKA